MPYHIGDLKRDPRIQTIGLKGLRLPGRVQGLGFRHQGLGSAVVLDSLILGHLVRVATTRSDDLRDNESRKFAKGPHMSASVFLNLGDP